MRNTSACNNRNSDDIMQGKRLMRTVVEFENDSLKKFDGKEKVNSFKYSLNLLVHFIFSIKFNS